MWFGSVEPATVLSGRSNWFDVDTKESLARNPLDCVETEFPHFVRSVDAPDGFERPKDRNPAFYGCFDWHSAVHSHWCLVRQLRLFEDHPLGPEIRGSIDERFTDENVEREVERFEADASFEEPYGWAWFLRLASELSLWEDSVAEGWRGVLTPLEARIVELVETEFLVGSRPFRVGTHHNSAFALQCVVDYARVASNDALESAAVETSKRFFADDRDYPVEYEPLGRDFLSPALVEADLMRRVLTGDEYARWVDGFFPDLLVPPFDTVLDPVAVEPGGGRGFHLVGLNLSKAWCLAGIVDALGEHRYVEAFERSAERHVERGLEQTRTGDYAGTHWLTSFALYLATRNEGGIAPE